MKKYWKARAASRLTRYSISQINICQGLFSLAVLFFDTQRTSFWVLGLLFSHHRTHFFRFLSVLKDGKGETMLKFVQASHIV